MKQDGMMVRSRGSAGLWFLMAVALAGGCAMEPLADDRANDVVQACCAAARSRVETVKDVESDKFRSRCGACKRGESKGTCERAAEKVQTTVRDAYRGDLSPMECSGMRSALGAVGVGIPESR